MTGLRLYKSEKLCGRTSVNLLFEQGRSCMAFPLRAVWRVSEPGQAPARMMITVPKKKIRRAVDRVLLRRRVREAYRLLRRTMLHPALERAGVGLDMAIIYVDRQVSDYAQVEERVRQLLARIARDVAHDGAHHAVQNDTKA